MISLKGGLAQVRGIAKAGKFNQLMYQAIRPNDPKTNHIYPLITATGLSLATLRAMPAALTVSTTRSTSL